ncbi:MAG: hypothetical protein RL660_950 [Bacteroidota bacterium]|jgi:two-component system LytT family response regulator
MMNVIIIDDELLARSLLKEYLSSYTNISVVAECANGFEGAKAIQTFAPDAIFLDVQMPKLNGFEMLEILDEPLPQVVFTTAFDEYALKAFEAQALDYLLKPFTQERLEIAIRKIEERISSNKPQVISDELVSPVVKSFQSPRIVVKDRHQIHIVPFSDIVFLEAADDYVKIHTATRHFLKKKTMAYFEDVLPSQEFCRVHRSYIVRISEIAKVEPWEKDGAVITLHNQHQIDVSKAGYVRLKEVLGI